MRLAAIAADELSPERIICNLKFMRMEMLTPVFEDVLDALEVRTGNDGFMVVTHVVLGKLTPVYAFFLG